MGKESADSADGRVHEAPPENLFSPPRLEIKLRQTRRTNCLGRMTTEPVGAVIGAGQ